MASESLLSCIAPFLRHLRISDLESRSGVIQGHRFWYQSKARVHVPISGQQQLGPYLAPFQKYDGLNVENRQLLFWPQFGGVLFSGRSVVLVSAQRGKVRLIRREIIVQEFPTYMTTIPQRYRRMDGRRRQTDGQLAMAIPRSA